MTQQIKDEAYELLKEIYIRLNHDGLTGVVHSNMMIDLDRRYKNAVEFLTQLQELRNTTSADTKQVRHQMILEDKSSD